MKLSRKEVQDMIEKTMEISPSPQVAARNILNQLLIAGVVKSTKRTEIIPRKDIELMPYDDEVIVEEFTLHL